MESVASVVRGYPIKHSQWHWVSFSTEAGFTASAVESSYRINSPNDYQLLSDQTKDRDRDNRTDHFFPESGPNVNPSGVGRSWKLVTASLITIF